jgi:hypothetical protein
MKTVSYKDPYELEPEVLQVRDEDADNLDEAMDCLKEETRIADNLERKERYHRRYRLENMRYQGTDYASDVDIEAEFLREEQERIIDEWLRKNLTQTQYRRFRYSMDGLSLHEIAELEGIDYKSARESVEAARKKLQKIYHDTPSETPSESPYYGE